MESIAQKKPKCGALIPRRHTLVKSWISVTWISVSWISVSCTQGGPQEVSEPQTSSPQSGNQDSQAQESSGGEANHLKNPTVPQGDADCVGVASIKQELPYYVASKNLVISRFVTPCTPVHGGVGLKPKSSWMAMGFPCTGGGGRVDVRGKYQNPNLVSFVIGTECAMVPAAKDQVQAQLAEVVGLPKDAPLMAYLPFVVQFWEVLGQRDADTGFAIELRTPPAIESIWKDFRESRNFNVRLYGRENSWVPGGHFYQVDATVIPEGRNVFRLQIIAVKKLSPEEINVVKARCEGLRPTRNCAAVF